MTSKGALHVATAAGVYTFLMSVCRWYCVPRTLYMTISTCNHNTHNRYHTRVFTTNSKYMSVFEGCYYAIEYIHVLLLYRLSRCCITSVTLRASLTLIVTPSRSVFDLLTVESTSIQRGYTLRSWQILKKVAICWRLVEIYLRSG